MDRDPGMNAISNSRWYVVQTHTHAETKAAHHLERQGFGVYLPRYLKNRRHARRVETVAAPLFPRYLFVLVDIAVQPWRCVRSTIGISSLVSCGDEPTPVSVSVIDALRSREDERGFIGLKAPLRFARGDRVRVLDGVFSECAGLFDAMTDSERVTVLLDLLGRKVRVVMDMDCVVAA
jgi:transcriptional antiterminator RfaH